MADENTEEPTDPIDAKDGGPNAHKVPPHDGGYAPVESREPIEDEGQPYTGHRVLDQTSLGIAPIIPRGKAPTRRVDD